MPKSKTVTWKEAFYNALADTVKVVLWSGIPATGIYADIRELVMELPIKVRYAVFLSAGLNVLAFFVIRLAQYKLGKKEVKTN